MFTDTLVGKASFKKTCSYCSLRIENPQDEQYLEGRVYHKECRKTLLLRKQEPEVFRNVSDIRLATETLFETSPEWMVENKLRIMLIHRAVRFLLKSFSPKQTSHNQLSKGGMTTYRGRAY